MLSESAISRDLYQECSDEFKVVSGSGPDVKYVPTAGSSTPLEMKLRLELRDSSGSKHVANSCQRRKLDLLHCTPSILALRSLGYSYLTGVV